MEHTDKIVVKVNKSTVQISSNITEKEGTGPSERLHEWKLNKRTTMPEDCKVDTIDVACDKKKCVVKVSCDKIEGKPI